MKHIRGHGYLTETCRLKPILTFQVKVAGRERCVSSINLYLPVLLINILLFFSLCPQCTCLHPSLAMSPPRKPWKLDKFWHKEKDAAGEDGTTSSTDTDQAGGDTVKVLEVISYIICQGTLITKIEEVKIGTSLILQDFQKLRERVTEMDLLAQPHGG